MTIHFDDRHPVVRERLAMLADLAEIADGDDGTPSTEVGEYLAKLRFENAEVRAALEQVIANTSRAVLETVAHGRNARDAVQFAVLQSIVFGVRLAKKGLV